MTMVGNPCDFIFRYIENIWMIVEYTRYLVAVNDNINRCFKRNFLCDKAYMCFNIDCNMCAGID